VHGTTNKKLQKHVLPHDITTPEYRPPPHPHPPRGEKNLSQHNSDVTRQTQIFGCLDRQPGPKLSEELRVKVKEDRERKGEEDNNDTNAILREEICIRHTTNNKSIRTRWWNEIFCDLVSCEFQETGTVGNGNVTKVTVQPYSYSF
jgi:hypothetical protein